MVQGITKVLREKGLYKGRVGLIGSNILSMKHFYAIQRALPDVEWVPADHLLNKQMIIKSEMELNIIRHACKAVKEVTDLAFDMAKPGIQERELGTLVAQGLADQWCELCWIRPNSSRRLEPGEIYCMGLVGWCQGYIFDISRSKVIGNTPNPKQAQLLNLINEFVLRQAEELRPGRAAGEAAQFGLRYFVEEKKEFSREEFEAGILGTFAAFGHGLGLAWERPILKEEEDMVLAPGMYIAVEVAYHKLGIGLAEAEINLEITEKGPRILTNL
jgi:Xaa-Pro aminopeptidase